MNERDPLDDLLIRAFDADRARTPTVDVTERVMRRIRLRQRARALTLAAATVAGALALARSFSPALDALLGVLPDSTALPVDEPGSMVTLMLLAAAGAVWLMMKDEEPI